MSLKLEPPGCCYNLSQTAELLRKAVVEIVNTKLTVKDEDDLTSWMVKLADRIDWLVTLDRRLNKFRTLFQMLENSFYREWNYLQETKEQRERMEVRND